MDDQCTKRRLVHTRVISNIIVLKKNHIGFILSIAITNSKKPVIKSDENLLLLDYVSDTQ